MVHSRDKPLKEEQKMKSKVFLVGMLLGGLIFGGTTAWSGGWMWIPRNPLARAAGIEEPLQAPLDYLRHELGHSFDEERALTYLAQAPRMLEFFRSRTALQFIDATRQYALLQLAVVDHLRTDGKSAEEICAEIIAGRNALCRKR